jgi:hypothetical protein
VGSADWPHLAQSGPAPATPSSGPRLPHLPTLNPLDELGPLQLEEELWWLAGCPDDLDGLQLRAQDVEPPDDDRMRRRIESGDTSWSLDLADPYAWLEPRAEASPERSTGTPAARAGGEAHAG